MKALIIYDEFASAVKASTALRLAAHLAKFRAHLNIRPWRADILTFELAAEEALMEAVDADLIVLAGSGLYSFLWLKDWLETWADRRQARDCALVMVGNKIENKGSAREALELYLFAKKQGLDFIVEHGIVMLLKTRSSFEESPR
jgi:hypothetical protein